MASIFTHVKEALASRLPEVLEQLLPNGRVQGREYVCGSLQGGEGTSCLTNLDTGKGSDFATDECWGDIIALAAKVWNMRQYEAAQELAKMYGIGDDWKSSQQGRRDRRQEGPQCNQQANQVRNAIAPVPINATLPPSKHGQYGTPSRLWGYVDAQNRIMHYVARFAMPQGKVNFFIQVCVFNNKTPLWERAQSSHFHEETPSAISGQSGILSTHSLAVEYRSVNLRRYRSEIKNCSRITRHITKLLLAPNSFTPRMLQARAVLLRET